MHRVVTSFIVAGTFCGVFGGCASTGTPAPDEHQPTDRIVAMGGTAADTRGAPGGGGIGSSEGLVVHATDYYTGLNARIHAPLESVMDTLSGIFHDLGVPITTRTTVTGEIGNRSYRVPGHQLNSVQLSQILDCGMTPMAGRRTDVDAITIDVIATIKATPDGGSTVNTYVTGSARPYASSTDPVHCSSSGWLERRINDRLVRLFGGSGD